MTSSNLYLAFIGFIALLRLGELFLAQRNLKNVGTQAEVVAEPRFSLMVLMHSLMYVVIPLELFWRRPTLGGALTWIALVIVILALIARYWTLRTMGTAWHVRILKGPQLPVITDGPFRYVRHPNYAIVMVELLFIPLIHHLYLSAIGLTVMNAWVLNGRIRQEEEWLSQRPDWVREMQSKPRFFPRLFGREP